MKNPVGRPLGKNPNLNKAEQLVADELLAGKKSEEIAEALFVSQSTVKFHLTNIYRKMGVKHDRAFMAIEFAKYRQALVEELEAKFLNNECISLGLHESRMSAADDREKNLTIKIVQLEKEIKELKLNQNPTGDRLPLGLNPITGI